VLGQSQPRLSRHLKLLVEAGLLERDPGGLERLFPDARRRRPRSPGPGPAAGGGSAPCRRPPRAARLAAERARTASQAAGATGIGLGQMRALGLPAGEIEAGDARD
jgi:ArsR family transcriptional regulator